MLDGVLPSIRYVTGDATDPQGDGVRIIAHVCNDIGAWGSGFVLAISARWPEPGAEYQRWAAHGPHFELGWTQLVCVDEDEMTWVANMIAQAGTIRHPSQAGRPPVRYQALLAALRSVGTQALRMGASVHMPRIGCGLAGGNWAEVEPLVTRALCSRGVPVTVYDLPPGPRQQEQEPS
jgi:O-acetyl-ADP-ribose deacetylase (regulator of RNase III)